MSERFEPSTAEVMLRSAVEEALGACATAGWRADADPLLTGKTVPLAALITGVHETSRAPHLWVTVTREYRPEGCVDSIGMDERTTTGRTVRMDLNLLPARAIDPETYDVSEIADFASALSRATWDRQASFAEAHRRLGVLAYGTLLGSPERPDVPMGSLAQVIDKTIQSCAHIMGLRIGHLGVGESAPVVECLVGTYMKGTHPRLLQLERTLVHDDFEYYLKTDRRSGANGRHKRVYQLVRGQLFTLHDGVFRPIENPLSVAGGLTRAVQTTTWDARLSAQAAGV